MPPHTSLRHQCNGAQPVFDTVQEQGHHHHGYPHRPQQKQHETHFGYDPDSPQRHSCNCKQLVPASLDTDRFYLGERALGSVHGKAKSDCSYHGKRSPKARSGKSEGSSRGHRSGRPPKEPQVQGFPAWGWRAQFQTEAQISAMVQLETLKLLKKLQKKGSDSSDEDNIGEDYPSDSHQFDENAQLVEYEDGSKYVGQIQDGKRHGHGMWKGRICQYDGQWFEDQQHGRGYLTWNDGRIYDGEFACKKFAGRGRMVWQTSNGMQTYTGEYKDDMKWGNGKFVWADGRIYDGQWVKGQRHGKGFYINSKGEKRTGNWFNDKFERDPDAISEEGRSSNASSSKSQSAEGSVTSEGHSTQSRDCSSPKMTDSTSASTLVLRDLVNLTRSFV